jgi:hypothetical protein
MQKAIECLRQRTLPTYIDLSPGKRKRIYAGRCQNPFKRRTKKNKFEIIRKLETIRTTINNIKNEL